MTIALFLVRSERGVTGVEEFPARCYFSSEEDAKAHAFRFLSASLRGGEHDYPACLITDPKGVRLYVGTVGGLQYAQEHPRKVAERAAYKGPHVFPNALECRGVPLFGGVAYGILTSL